MNWIITTDSIGDEPTAIGKCSLPWGNQGPPSAMKSEHDRLNWVQGYLQAHGTEFPFEFRLFDGDDELCYEGRCGDCTNVDADTAFAPLDWATFNAGCTTMHYRQLGEEKWSRL